MLLCGFSINVTFPISPLRAIQNFKDYKYSNTVEDHLLLKQGCAVWNQALSPRHLTLVQARTQAIEPVWTGTVHHVALMQMFSLALHHCVESRWYFNLIFIRYMLMVKLQRYGASLFLDYPYVSL